NSRYLLLPGRAHRGIPGVHLITPLRLVGHGDAVLVNRGWVPSADAATIDARDFAVPDSVSVRGLILPFPSSRQSLAQRGGSVQADTFRHVLYTIDEHALRAQFPYRLLDLMLQELPVAGGARYPTKLDPPSLDQGPHLGYALQWFAFAVIGVFGWFALVLRRRAPRARVPAVVLLLLAAPPDAAAAQLRPLEPLEWRIFDDEVRATGSAGAGVLGDQPAPLAGTRGTLFEIGTWSAAVRSARIAIQLDGTAVWRLAERDTLAEPAGGVAPAVGARQDPGPVYASTAFRMSPDSWPADIVLRFGTALPTTSDESGLERDRIDFFALLGARYRRGGLALTAENGLGINGTRAGPLPQSDVWTYAFGASYAMGALRIAGDLVGRQDGHAFVIRGNEDLRELRAGFDIGGDRWLRVRYVRGLHVKASPGHGLRVSAGILLTRRQ
ncbi:MAG: SURF1 family protein, partial [Longimicrobiales bacterium]